MNKASNRNKSSTNQRRERTLSPQPATHARAVPAVPEVDLHFLAYAVVHFPSGLARKPLEVNLFATKMKRGVFPSSRHFVVRCSSTQQESEPRCQSTSLRVQAVKVLAVGVQEKEADHFLGDDLSRLASREPKGSASLLCGSSF